MVMDPIFSPVSHEEHLFQSGVAVFSSFLHLENDSICLISLHNSVLFGLLNHFYIGGASSITLLGIASKKRSLVSIVIGTIVPTLSDEELPNLRVPI